MEITKKKFANEYFVFIDNDVLVSEEWLGLLIDTAQKKKADAVSPLICQGLPAFKTVHIAGGRCSINGGELIEKIYDQGKDITKYHDKDPFVTELFEFHCVLVRASSITDFDQELYNTREHIDMSLEVNKKGGQIYVQPQSVVSYLPPELDTLYDF